MNGRSWPTVGPALVRRVAFASLLAHIGIVLTGGAVRLTGSGLGCPTWPRCTDESWTSTAEMGLHGVIEFGNRLLTFVLTALAIAGVVAVWRLRANPSARRRLRWPAVGVLAGVAVQGGLGGLTVLTALDPWLVGAHFLVSAGIIAVAYVFWRRARTADAPPLDDTPPPPSGLRALATVTAVATAALVAVGTVVTGSGPHAGDAAVARNGLDPQVVAQVHADLAFLVVGLAVGAWYGLRAAGAAPAATRAAGLLLAALLGQGAVGMVQHYTGLPELLVWLHLLGACLVWLAAVHLYAVTRAPHRPTGDSGESLVAPAAPAQPSSPPAPAADEPVAAEEFAAASTASANRSADDGA